jgi:hypothetical protein
MTGQDVPNVLHWINESQFFFKTRTPARKTVFFFALLRSDSKKKR